MFSKASSRIKKQDSKTKIDTCIYNAKNRAPKKERQNVTEKGLIEKNVIGLKLATGMSVRSASCSRRPFIDKD